MGSSQLRDIRAAAARLCDDWVQFIATSDSADTTVLIDTNAGVENDQHFRGSDLWFLNDAGTTANRGISVRVLASDLGNSSISLGPGLVSAPVTGDEAWAFNIGGEGTRKRTYDALANDAILSLGEAGYPIYSYELTDVWDRDVLWVDIPALFTHVSGAQYQDSDSNWITVPAQSLMVDEVNKTFTLSQDVAALADGYTVRLVGRKAPSRLVDDDDTTDVDYEWLRYEVAAQALINKNTQVMVNKGGMYKNYADSLRGKAAPFNTLEGSVRVR